MPKEDSAKTALAPKTTSKSLLLWVCFVVVAVLVCVYILLCRQVGFTPSESVQCQTNPNLQVIDIRQASNVLRAEVARSLSEKSQGLSGRDCLAKDAAMLFPYDTPGEYCFWMKDMKFDIDMVWLDADKKIVTIKSNATPESYPKESFCPEKPAQYIVEVQAGLSDKLGWGIGTQLSF